MIERDCTQSFYCRIFYKSWLGNISYLEGVVGLRIDYYLSMKTEGETSPAHSAPWLVYRLLTDVNSFRHLKSFNKALRNSGSRNVLSNGWTHDTIVGYLSFLQSNFRYRMQKSRLTGYFNGLSFSVFLFHQLQANRHYRDGQSMDSSHTPPLTGDLSIVTSESKSQKTASSGDI